MTLTLMLCLLATLVPVFFSRVSAAPVWLSVQALALGWITLNQHSPLSLHAALAGAEVLLVPPSADLMPGEPEQQENQPDHEHDDPDGPEDGDLEKEPRYQQDDAEDDHGVPLR